MVDEKFFRCVSVNALDIIRNEVCEKNCGDVLDLRTQDCEPPALPDPS